MTLHAWDIATPEPRYVCGREPRQPSFGGAVVLCSRYTHSLRRALACRDLCAHCRRGLERMRRKG